MTSFPKYDSLLGENDSTTHTGIQRAELCESDLFRRLMTKAMFTEVCNLHLARKRSYENLQTLAKQAIVDLVINRELSSGNECLRYESDIATRCAGVTSIFTQSLEHLNKVNNDEMMRVLNVLTELSRWKTLL